ncbi:MAG: hypothetical protein WBP13_06390 [Methylophilaceae bacterium]
MSDNKIAAENIQLGDIFYIQVSQRYYFLQVIHVTENATELYGQSFNFGYFLMVLNKTFLELPSAIDELDLIHIYQPKFIWKKTLFYFGLWDKEPRICFDETLMHFDYKDKYPLIKFGNTPVSPDLSPAISRQFSLPLNVVYNEDDVQISASPASIQLIIWAIEEEEKGKLKKRVAINPHYFKEWLDYVEPSCIVKIEKIITQFDMSNIEEDIQKALKKAVMDINKLDDKFSFIGTIEAEAIVEVLTEIAEKRGQTDQQAILTIDQHRNW